MRLGTRQLATELSSKTCNAMATLVANSTVFGQPSFTSKLRCVTLSRGAFAHPARPSEYSNDRCI
jgi:hypothetical protein